MPKPTLSQVSGPRSRPLAAGAPPRTFAHPLRPCGFHSTPAARPSGPAEQEGHLRSLVPHLCRNAARSGARSPPSRRRNRLLQRTPQLESEIGASSPCPLCSSGRRPFPRLPALDPLALSLLSPRQGAGASLPRQVCRRSQTGLRRRPTGLLRGSQAFGKSESVRFFPPSPLSAGLGGLLQAALRWSRTRSPLSRPLHPPRGDLQSPPGLPRGQTSDLPLERLCIRQPATVDDSGGRGVLAPLPAPRASPGLRPHSSFRLSGPPTAHRSLAPLLPGPRTN